MNTQTYTLHGYAALRIARRDGVTLYYQGTVPMDPKLATPREYASLTAKVTPDGWRIDIAGVDYPADGSETAGYNVSDYFHESRYLGPDQNGIEPRWKDA